jgi:hypothetical protein
MFIVTTLDNMTVIRNSTLESYAARRSAVNAEVRADENSPPRSAPSKLIYPARLGALAIQAAAGRRQFAWSVCSKIVGQASDRSGEAATVPTGALDSAGGRTNLRNIRWAGT